jgi:RNA polymerase sigma-32 factor
MKKNDHSQESENKKEETALEAWEPSFEEETLPIVSKKIASEVFTHHDPLERYLQEIRKHHLLTLEEEQELVLEWKTHGNVNAAKTLISANLRLVVKIAFEYRTVYANILDLIQEGNIGLMKAVAKFDPTKGARLGYYASWWIRSYILKYLLDNFRLVKIGTTQAQKKLFYHLMREKERIEAQGLLAGPKLLAKKLNVREKDVIEMQQRLSSQGQEMSLDTPIISETETTHLELLADPRETADIRLEKNQLISLLKSKLPAFEKSLNEKEKQILQERLLSEEPKTLQEIADQYQLTRERARQIEAKVIEKLKILLQGNLHL